jgi:hypothetical protein
MNLPEKSIWTDADFAAMSWHDAALHAVAIEPSLPHPGRRLVDLDYIVARRDLRRAGLRAGRTLIGTVLTSSRWARHRDVKYASRRRRTRVGAGRPRRG